MPQIPSNIAQIVAVFIECIFYGVYLVTFAASIQSIASSHAGLSWPSRFKRQQSMLIIVLLIFSLSTLNLGLGLLRILAFINHDFVGSGAVQQLGQDWLNIIKPFSVNLETLVADYVLIYRCWILYHKSPRVVILPIILYLGGMVSTILAVIIGSGGWLQGVKTSGSRINGDQILPVNIGFWVSTISINIYATSMIVLYIWRVERENRGRNTLAALYATSHPSRPQIVMKAVIESGLLYTITSITAFISLATGSNSIFITTAVDVQVIGIAFNLILIRVKRHSEGTVITRTRHATSTAIDFAHVMTSSNSAFASRSGPGVPTDRHVDSKAIVDIVPRALNIEPRTSIDIN